MYRRQLDFRAKNPVFPHVESLDQNLGQEHDIAYPPTYFDMESVWVLPGKPIQLWFRKRDGTRWFWPELRTGTIWNTRDWIRDVSEVRINSAVPLGDDINVIGGFGLLLT